MKGYTDYKQQIRAIYDIQYAAMRCVIGERRKANIDQRHRTRQSDSREQAIHHHHHHHHQCQRQGVSQSSKHPFTVSIPPWSFPLPVLFDKLKRMIGRVRARATKFRRGNGHERERGAA